MNSKRYAHVDSDSCVSCGACTKECPRGAVSIWRGCYAIVDESICVGCALCSRICPAGCIEMIQREGE